MSDLNTELAKYGIDYNDGVERIENADFYKKLALKYLNDSNYVDLVAALDVKDYDEAYKAAHALKGVSGNLSLAELHKAATAINNALAEGEMYAAHELLPQVTAAHEKALEGLEMWANGEIQ